MMATDFHWPPDDVGHYLAMQREVADLVAPRFAERSIIAKRCKVSVGTVSRWRIRHGIRALAPTSERLARLDRPIERESYRKNDAAINGVPYSAPTLMSEDEFTVLMDDRSFEDDPRAAEGRL